MNKMLSMAAVLAVAVGLSACATPEPAADQQLAGVAPSSKLNASSITGSRIPSKKTDQAVQAIDGKEYERTMRNLANPYEK
ncbi:hypothetical protein GJ699_25510 [Duganella sp. FT80W]|uniref:Uncharacterized protein n=1 Tax=Duganella guangzhouensis TaxID=2666084 RepID=A0A6I2L5A7_9BURK|nr:hypothetical protein [Duganella guangzhouensis]MRW93351.1 hypothetical protein [Duganella guangzhouensis]